ncbi:hypothetical protein AB4Y38_43420, partial [Paraburkholderia sp. EG285A]
MSFNLAMALLFGRTLAAGRVPLCTQFASMIHGSALPPAELVLSATAPLSEKLALEAEARLKAPLVEIYGSTETGQIA